MFANLTCRILFYYVCGFSINWCQLCKSSTDVWERISIRRLTLSFQAFLVSKDIGMKWSQQTDYSRFNYVALKETGILLNHKLYLHSLLICHDLWFYINALGAQIKLQIFCWWSRWKVLFKNFLVWDWEVNTDVDSRKLSLWFVTELPLTQTFPDC